MASAENEQGENEDSDDSGGFSLSWSSFSYENEQGENEDGDEWQLLFKLVVF